VVNWSVRCESLSHISAEHVHMQQQNVNQSGSNMQSSRTVTARMSASGLIGIRMVIIGIWLQTWMRLIVYVDV